MLLRYGLGEENAAKRIENAVLGTLDMGFRTGDIFSTGKVSVYHQFLFLLVDLMLLVHGVIFSQKC